MPTSPYTDASPSALEADAALLQGVVQKIQSLITEVGADLDRANLNATTEALSDLADALTDVRADHAEHPLSLIAEALAERDAARERRHVASERGGLMHHLHT